MDSFTKNRPLRFYKFCIVILLIFVLYTFSTIKLRINIVKNSKRAKIESEVKILFWTYVSNGTIIDKIQSQSPVPKWCHLTFDRNKVNTSDAVIFRIPWHENKANDMPKWRKDDQIWAFQSLESPAYMNFDMNEWVGFKFNRTLTYRLDSDFPTPYGIIVARNKSINSRFPPETKTKLAVWLVSNCNTPSKRKEFVRKLQKFIQVDIYGKCGNLSCEQKSYFDYSCYEKFSKQYKFYLALENSFCVDYVTEKFFNALYFGMVPIGLSGADYGRFAPTGSYIDVRDFSSVKELADFLIMLDKNQTAYKQYFEWKQYYEVKIRQTFAGYEKLCFAIRDGNELKKSFGYKNMKKWWTEGSCTAGNVELFKE